MGGPNNTNLTNRPYVGLIWSEPIGFNRIVVYHDNYGPDPTGIALFVSKSPIKSGDELKDETWTQIASTEYRYVPVYNSLDYPTATFYFNETQTGIYAIKMVQYRYRKSGQQKMVIKEFCVYKDEVVEERYDVSSVNAVLTEINKAFGTDNSYGYSDETWKAFADARAEATQAAKDCAGKVIDPVGAYPDQDALNEVGARLIKAAQALKLTEEEKASAKGNVLYRGLLFWDASRLQYSAGIQMSALTDGKTKRNDPITKSNWQSDLNGGYCFLQLTEPSDINNMVIWSDNPKATYELYYVTDTANATAYNEFDKLEWTKIEFEKEYGLSHPSGFSADNFSDTHAIKFKETIEDIAALKIVAKNADAIMEVAAYCDEPGDPDLTDVQGWESDGKDKQLWLVHVSKQEMGDKALQATYTIKDTKSGKSVTKTVNIENAYPMIAFDNGYVTSNDFKNGHYGDYIAGILINNVSEDMEITVTFAAVEAPDPTGSEESSEEEQG